MDADKCRRRRRRRGTTKYTKEEEEERGIGMIAKQQTNAIACAMGE
jgi:hypothetical protein